MGRKKAEINPKQKKNFKRFLELSGTTQVQLSRIINYSQQCLSGIATGNQRMTDDVASEIVKHFPEFRKQFLLGYDDYPKEIDKKRAEVIDIHDRLAILEKWFTYTTEVMDTTMDEILYDPASPSSRLSVLDTEDGKIFVNENGDRCYPDVQYRLTRDGLTANLTHDEMSNFKNEILRFIDFRFSELFRERGN